MRAVATSRAAVEAAVPAIEISVESSSCEGAPRAIGRASAQASMKPPTCAMWATFVTDCPASIWYMFQTSRPNRKAAIPQTGQARMKKSSGNSILSYGQQAM